MTDYIIGLVVGTAIGLIIADLRRHTIRRKAYELGWKEGVDETRGVIDRIIAGLKKGRN